jgi:hypothetical protein
MADQRPEPGRERTFGQQHPRHPAEVTADRLGDAVTRWSGKFDSGEKDMIGMIIHALREIAEGGR